MIPACVKCHPDDHVFGANHRQHLMVAFRHFDEALSQVLADVGAPPGVPLFRRALDDSDEGMRERAEADVAVLRGQLGAFMATHAIQPAVPAVTVSHIARAAVEVLAVHAAELGRSHLRGYGALSAEEERELDALAARLREALDALEQALRCQR